jgi:tRNA threonylcarbamoyladenosine biosynthesis protein TsaB
MILAIDTATRIISLALRADLELIAETTWPSANHHTVELAPAVDTLLGRAGVTPDGVTCIAVSLGPGSFTGLRIGLSFAKGFVLAVPAIRMIGVPTLDIVAEAQPFSPGVDQLCAVLQAGRGRIGVLSYTWADGWVSSGQPLLTTWADLIPKLDRPTLVAGEVDAAGHQALKEAGDRFIVAPPAQCLRRAGFLAEIAAHRLAEGRLDDPASLAPIYLH